MSDEPCTQRCDPLCSFWPECKAHSDMPPRIWAGRTDGFGGWHEAKDFVNNVEYVRADIHAAEIERLRAENEALIHLLQCKDYIRLRSRYDAGQLSFAGQIEEMERRALDYTITP